MVHVEIPIPNSVKLVFDDDLLNTNVDEHTQAVRGILKDLDSSHPQWSSLELELTQAAMVDSRGLNLLVSLIKEAEARSAKVTACISSPTLQKTFSFLKLDKRMLIVLK